MDKILKILTVKEVNEVDDRTIRFLGTDETQDRAEDILTADGWEIDNYTKNPVFLWAHKYDQPPVGKTISLTFDSEKKGWLFDVQFATKDEYPFADTIHKLYKGKYLNAVSVGFIPKKYDGEKGFKVTKKELLELSGCPVPCNPNALQMSFQKAMNEKAINEQEYIELLEVLKGTKQKSQIDILSEKLDQLEKEIEELKKSISEKQTCKPEIAPENIPTVNEKIAGNMKGIYENLFSADKSKQELLSEQEIQHIKNLIIGGKKNES